jgi:hypothetical protein
VDPALVVPKHAAPAAVPFTPRAEVQKAVHQRLAAIDLEALDRRTVEEVSDQSRDRFQPRSHPDWR